MDRIYDQRIKGYHPITSPKALTSAIPLGQGQKTVLDARQQIQQILEGKLWHTNSIWQWRVWSVNAAGDVAFSESRPMPH